MHFSVKIGAKRVRGRRPMRTVATQLFGRNATRILQVALIQAESAIRSKNNDNNRGAWA